MWARNGRVLEPVHRALEGPLLNSQELSDINMAFIKNQMV